MKTLDFSLRRLSVLASVLLAVGALVPAHAAPGLDARLSMATAKHKAAGKPARALQDRAEELVPVTIRFHGTPQAALQALGVRLGSVSGNIMTAQVPLDRLREVAQVPGVEYVEASRRMPARLALSVPATGATALRSGPPMQWSGATGQGVIIGVVDDGLDFRHPDFRHADGTTRLLGLWDMRAEVDGSPPSGFDYGNECTTAQLNRAIAEGLGSRACLQPSSGNHGTHVGGIAAGNGQATGNGLPAFRHVGMAPMADLMAANVLNADVQASNAVLDGVQYIKARARALGKPAVINLSLGSYYGSRDGTSNYETALSNAVGPGFIITAAAGNEGDAPIRAEAALAQGQTVAIGYHIPAGKEAGVQMWYPGAHRWSVRASRPGCRTDWVAAGTDDYTKDTPCGTVTITNNDPNPLNGDREVLIEFEANAQGQEPGGDWTIEVKSVQGSGTVSMIGGEDRRGPTFTDHISPVTTQILIDTCTATGTICVGAYVTRQQWDAVGGQHGERSDMGAVGDVARFSSRGPRRNCSAPALCPAVAKPEILAPGAMIISALGHDAEDGRQEASVDADGQHVAYMGTSMATPHVSGAVAMLLQKNPTLDGPAVKALLLANPQRTAFSPVNLPLFNAAVPNPAGAHEAWGYGVLDIAKAWAAAPGGVPGTGAIRSQVSGDARGLTLSATITAAAGERDLALQAWVVAVLPGGEIFSLDSRQQWQPLSAGLQRQGQFSGDQPYQVEVFRQLAHAGSGLGGTAIFVGYGTSEEQMLQQRKFQLIHVMQP